MKTHPASIILIEHETHKLWRIVERATTSTGVDPDLWREIEGRLPDYPKARAVFDALKKSTPN